ncbi:MAG: BglII/BstYI family type II restriction endonuclease [Brevundimonas sp.]|uniref:BglII/BstYI family type II restriction endonuclease n=1 Tax=Brevundimonas sp. TaxID=1871086 RepID=UPI002721BE1D|nr:BglII/BstYI family type II restriction endonuclease [Brevundimonas sp.]MDO9607435.1 BglII/BstYI family type II restriction endonuclease [Brevundimonas sp.]
MKYQVYSYRYAEEILQHPNNREAYDEIVAAVENVPLFTYAGKSKRNAKLDVVQQVMNTWFDRELSVERRWLYHPAATTIKGSGLAADFRKTFDNITVQAEVQFGNMSRWYSDVFKFQTAYSQGLIDVGLCIVPMGVLGRRIDSNVVSYERILRELPSAKMSLTLPILVIGIEPDEQTETIDLKRIAGIPFSRLINSAAKTGGGQSEHNRYRVIQALREEGDPYLVDETSDTGPMAKAIIAEEPIDNGD